MRCLPPKCPCCKKRLVKVFENDYAMYVFDHESGRYRDSDGYLEMFCPYYDSKLYDVLEHGVCNYVSPDKNKKIQGMTKKQAIFWLSVALQVHHELEIVEAFQIAMNELSKDAYRRELRVGAIYC